MGVQIKDLDAQLIMEDVFMDDLCDRGCEYLTQVIDNEPYGDRVVQRTSYSCECDDPKDCQVTIRLITQLAKSAGVL